MKPIRLTLHAATVATERGIPQDVIEQVVRSPEWKVQDGATTGADRRYAPVLSRDHRVLPVVCIETDAEIRVITVFFDRDARRPA